MILPLASFLNLVLKDIFPARDKHLDKATMLVMLKCIYFTSIEKQVLTTYTNLSRFCLLCGYIILRFFCLAQVAQW